MLQPSSGLATGMATTQRSTLRKKGRRYPCRVQSAGRLRHLGPLRRRQGRLQGPRPVCFGRAKGGRAMSVLFTVRHAVETEATEDIALQALSA